jgi:hypothetical protein
LLLRVAAQLFRRCIVKPVLFLVHRGKLAAHAFLVWRKGEADQV